MIDRRRKSLGLSVSTQLSCQRTKLLKKFESLPCSKSCNGNIDGFDFMVYYMVHVTPGCDSRGTEKLFF